MQSGDPRNRSLIALITCLVSTSCNRRGKLLNLTTSPHVQNPRSISGHCTGTAELLFLPESFPGADHGTSPANHRGHDLGSNRILTLWSSGLSPSVSGMQAHLLGPGLRMRCRVSSLKQEDVFPVLNLLQMPLCFAKLLCVTAWRSSIRLQSASGGEYSMEHFDCARTQVYYFVRIEARSCVRIRYLYLLRTKARTNNNK